MSLLNLTCEGSQWVLGQEFCGASNSSTPWMVNAPFATTNNH